MSNNPEHRYTELSFTVNNLQLAARSWGKQGNIPILALHGWLDNCASFQPLAELLPDSHIVALDLAGHGRSSRRSADSGYNLWQDVDEVLQVADQLGWRQFSLLGHSRGAMISILLAAIAPERISRVALIDGLVPIPVVEADAPGQLANAIRDKHKYRNRQRRRYSTLEQALDTRTAGLFPLSPNSARLMAEQGLERDDKGYYWVADPRLQGASEVKFTDGQLRAFLRQVCAPVILFLGSEAMDFKREKFASYWGELKDHQLFVFEGGHHLHMDGAQQQIAEKLSFIPITTGIQHG